MKSSHAVLRGAAMMLSCHLAVRAGLAANDISRYEIELADFALGHIKTARPQEMCNECPPIDEYCHSVQNEEAPYRFIILESVGLPLR